MQIDKSYIEKLVSLGLKPQEASVYLACLKLGESTVAQIAKESDVQRTFVYDIVNDLTSKGILSLIETENVKKYTAISVDQFKKIQLEKIRQFEEIIPDLRAIESIGEDSPKVKFYAGKEGIKTALYDTLTLPQGGEILAYATATGFYEEEKGFADEYIKARVNKDISYRSIVPDSDNIREYIKSDEDHKRITRLIPANKFNFTNEINIYGNKMLIISLQKELLAVIIESESVANTQRMIFELAWMGAEKR